MREARACAAADRGGAEGDPDFLRIVGGAKEGASAWGVPEPEAEEPSWQATAENIQARTPSLVSMDSEPGLPTRSWSAPLPRGVHQEGGRLDAHRSTLSQCLDEDTLSMLKEFGYTEQSHPVHSPRGGKKTGGPEGGGKTMMQEYMQAFGFGNFGEAVCGFHQTMRLLRPARISKSPDLGA
uniref:Uncharacterized protein n=1 Tax=Hemiselmis tepida TaxID=464990 RepID=A0A7S0YX06_9CRYP|mmetsp:Transcript_33319/g.85417  ORF Transcript_33319/g.85417 Transcript_33319/m.85417 type:complete len:181 (+) Transcript_33319:292-834(+)